MATTTNGAAPSGGSGLHLDLNEVVKLLGLVIPFVPETTKFQGKTIQLRQLVSDVLADGKLDPSDVLKIIIAWQSAPKSKPLPVPPILAPHVPDASGEPVLKPTPDDTNDAPVTPAKIYPTSCTIEITEFKDNENKDILFTVDDAGDHWQVRRTDGVESISGGYRAVLGVAYIDAAGEPINFEDRGTPYLYNTSKWIATRLETGESDQVSRGGRTERGVVNWARYNETGPGMNPVAKFPEVPSQNRGATIEITVEVPTDDIGGRVTCDKPLRMPPQR